MKWLIIFFTTFNLSLNGLGQVKISTHGQGASQFWLIYDDSTGIQHDHLIIFLHGYGASNPGCYGEWIKSLASQGNAVVFPKFQIGTFLPRTKAYQKRTEQVIYQAIDELRETHSMETRKISFVGHSIGGVIAANLSDNFGKDKGLEIGALILCQPGFKHLKLGRKESYSHISKNVLLINITGQQDRAAGRKFARLVYNTTPQIPEAQKLWIEHQTYITPHQKLSSHHKDPVSPFKPLDAGNRNIVIGGAFLLCQTDEVDKNAYWNPCKTIIRQVNKGLNVIPAQSFPSWIVEVR